MNNSHKQRTQYSKDDWQTPDYFYKILNDEFNFTLDPCADDLNHKTEKYFTLQDNGLEQNWTQECVFVNPPFKYKDAWIEKCYKESLKDKITIVLIIPVTSDTKAWFDYILNNKCDELRLCYKRVNFELPAEAIKQIKARKIENVEKENISESEKNKKIEKIRKKRKLDSPTFPLAIIIYRNPRKFQNTQLSCFKHR